ncbi:hypothetical protein [Paraglaciecola sp. L3A3]|uniref:hypothetical protein n=1 Tax=Paraglaciecola sp. L3A3 TaxID=2686358 RepID=UPI00131DD193|nr:hypothetical protein [Paraglaciecola sp. L3A3]
MFIKQSLAIVTILLATSACSLLPTPSYLPAELANQYSSSVDDEISDEFNSGKLDTSKWTYRKRAAGGLGRGTEFVNFAAIDGTNEYVSLKGIGAQQKGSGISSLKAVDYGFYATRWRTTGIKTDVATSFHPAIWGFWGNAGEVNKGISPKNRHTLEIDLMEFGNWPTPTHWSTDAPAFFDGKRIVATGSANESDIDFDGDKAVMLGAPNETRINHSDWTTLGMEYTPEYLQLWEQVNGQWYKIGDTVFFTDKNTQTSINKLHRNKCYWLLSNLFIEFGNKPRDRSDTSLDVDYFRFYPIK